MLQRLIEWMWAGIFDGFTGTMVLYDEKQDIYFVYNEVQVANHFLHVRHSKSIIHSSVLNLVYWTRMIEKH